MRLFWTENVSWFAEVWILNAALYTEHSFDVHLYKAKVESRPMRDEINRAWTNQNRIPESEERRLSKYLHSVVWSNSSRHQPWWSCYVRETLDRKFILSDWLSVDQLRKPFLLPVYDVGETQVAVRHLCVLVSCVTSVQCIILCCTWCWETILWPLTRESWDTRLCDEDNCHQPAVISSQ